MKNNLEKCVMVDFNKLDYYARYEWDIAGIGADNRSSICFGTIFSKLENHEENYNSKLSGTITLFVNKDPEFAKSNRRDNYCILTRNEINYYLRFLNKFSENIKIKKVDYHKELSNDNFGIKMSFKDVYPYEMRLMLTFVRNMYESTYSLQLKTALLMKDVKEFRHLDFHQRLSVAVNSIQARGYGHSNYEHSMEFSTLEDILNRYKKIVCKATSVNSFYKRINLDFERLNYYENNQLFLDLIDNRISTNIMEILIYNYNLIKNGQN